MIEPSNLKEQVIDFINMQQEGEYWDFKKEWYAEGKKADLLHDIICMANNRRNCDAYIIIGVDESKGFKLSSVENDPNRRNTQKIVEFLKKKPFAGGVRPVVCVESLSIEGCLIDVIIIKNSRNTPFFLTETIDKVNAYSIHTRVMDTNTPINKTADINHVEELWKKRFRLDEKPMELVCYYLEDAENWESSPAGENMVYYYSHSPEYTIREEENDGKLQTYYMFVGADHNPYWFNVSVYYHQTALAQFPANALDGGRCCVIAPEHGSIRFDHPGGNPDITYEYYIHGSFRHKLLEFFYSNGIRTHGYLEYGYTFDRFMDLMLMFSSKNEQNAFDEYVKDNKDLYERLFTEVEEQSLPFDLKTGSDYKLMKTQYMNALVLKLMYKKFYSEE